MRGWNNLPKNIIFCAHCLCWADYQMCSSDDLNPLFGIVSQNSPPLHLVFEVQFFVFCFVFFKNACQSCRLLDGDAAAERWVKAGDTQGERSVSEPMSVTISALWEASDGGRNSQITAESGADSDVPHTPHISTHTLYCTRACCDSQHCHTHCLTLSPLYYDELSCKVLHRTPKMYSK